ncbi:MAG: hypothetical protein V1886_03175 [archaeon]
MAKTRSKKNVKSGKIVKKSSMLSKLSKEEKQTIAVVLFMIVIVASFLVFFFIFRNIGDFVYHGIKFQKTSSQGVTIYHGKIGLSTQSGTFNYNLYMRNDPRKLKIPSNVSIVLRRTGYISFQPEISNCYASNLAAFELASIMSALGISVKGATTSHEEAIKQDIPEKDCADAVNSTVIVLQQSQNSSIAQRGDCYILNIANCRVVDTAEAFVLEIVDGFWGMSAS